MSPFFTAAHQSGLNLSHGRHGRYLVQRQLLQDRLLAPARPHTQPPSHAAARRVTQSCGWHSHASSAPRGSLTAAWTPSVPTPPTPLRPTHQPHSSVSSWKMCAKASSRHTSCGLHSACEGVRVRAAARAALSGPSRAAGSPGPRARRWPRPLPKGLTSHGSNPFSLAKPSSHGPPLRTRP
jgi:hypothetical protein